MDIVDRQYSDQIEGNADVPPSDATSLLSWMRAGIDEIRSGSAPCVR